MADQAFDEVRHYIEQVIATQKAGTVSLSIAVAKDGEILWEEGFGWADVENRTRATEHTTYSLASISKPITATALMTLVEAGKIDLDRPANDYLGTGKLTGRPGDAKAATVCRLANHTSGLPTHVNFYYADEPMVLPTVNESISRYGKLVGIPGEDYVYSNLGYGILGEIGSRASESSYTEYVRETVFEPMGMSHSGVGVPPGLQLFAAVRYDKYAKVLPHYDFDHPGASAIYSSAHDLVRFGMMHVGGSVPGGKAVLSNASIERMRHPSCSQGGHEGYGLGWRVDQQSGYEIVSHGGSMPGVKTILAMIPEQNLVVVVLTNRVDDRSPVSGVPLRWQIANRAIKSLVPDWSLQYGESSSTENTAAPLPDSLLGEWRGSVETYESAIPLRITISK
ncbi:MAG: serine hydrolase domain-containing protein, partial [Woeseia sp.]